MSHYVDYDPEQHKGLPLFERVIEGEDMRYVPADVSEEVAARTSWYYVVEEKDEVQTDSLSEPS